MEFTNGSLLTGPHPRLDDTPTSILLKRDNHKVLRKSFQPGQGMAAHTAPNDVFVVVLSGEMVITVADTPQTYVAGDYVIFPAGAVHALQCVQAAQILIYL